jgi:HSP20 family protein
MNTIFPLSRFNLSSPISGDFETLIDAFFNTPLRNTRSEDSFYSVPRANVCKADDGYTIQLAAPGYSRDDFNIIVENNTLTISTTVELPDDDNTYTTREYSYTGFSRSWSLPKGTTADGIVARYDAGILSVVVPTLADGEPSITVNVE